MAVVTLVALAGCGGEAPPPESAAPAPVPVRTAAVERALTAPAVRATGLLVGKEEARLAFKLGGIVDRVLVDEGARVSKGQLLALLEQDEASSRVMQAQRSVEKAQRDAERAGRLHAEGVGPLQQVQDARTELDVARAALTMARFDATHARIEAPDDGVVLARLAEPSEMVQPGQAVLQFKSAEPGWIVRVGLADRDVVRVRLGDRAVARASALEGRPLEGAVTQIAAAASPTTGTFDVEIALAPSDATLLSGMHARVEIEPSMREPLALVPIDALLEGDGDNATVYALDEAASVARRRTVRVAFLRDGRAALRDGLDGVTQVVTDGVASLRDGSLVRLLPAEEVATGGTPGVTAAP